MLNPQAAQQLSCIRDREVVLTCRSTSMADTWGYGFTMDGGCRVTAE